MEGDRIPDGAELGRELSTAVVLFHEAIAHRLGLTAPDNRALGIITREGPVTAGALAERTGLTPGAVTGLVDRLERAGYVRRAADPADRRRVLISAVPGLPEVQGRAFAALGEAMGGFMARYDAEQVATVVDFCTNTIEVLREQTRRLGDPGAS
ncbi:MarR family transcriptional regulator [Saccharopolyspora cebuensis]